MATQQLIFLDENYSPFNEDPMRSFHDGHRGDSHEQLMFLRNKDPSVYYTGVEVVPQMIGNYNDAGEFGLTGWGIKLMYGKRRPTEGEWDLVRSGDGIQIPNIGSTEAADTFTNHPIWVRVYCPGNEPAQIRSNMQIAVSYFIRKVGA